MQDDHSLYRLDPYDAGEGYQSYTSNEPHTYAQKVIGWIVGAEMTVRIPHDQADPELREKNDIKERNIAIQKATIRAAEIPLEILELAIKSLKALQKLSQIANLNSISDLGVSLYLIYASAKGASMNVLINAKEFNNNLKEKYFDKIEYYDKELEALFTKINDYIYKTLND